MIKKLAIGCGALTAVGVIVVAALGWWVYRTMTGPMYTPGTGAIASAALEPPSQTGEAAWVVEPDVHLHHVARGTGAPVLFVHGGPGVPMREPMPWLDALAASVRVHYYDQRGCGASTRPFDRFASPNPWPNMQALEGALGLGTQIADIERIRRILGVEKLTLIGHSFGGLLAALYAAEFPDRIDALVLLAPADLLVLPNEGDDLFALVRAGLPEAKRAGYDQFLADYLDFGGLFAHSEEDLARRNLALGNYILEAMNRPALPAPPAGTTGDTGGWMAYAAYLSMGKHHDYTPALAAVRARTLVVHGSKDLQPDRAAAQYAGLISGAELLRVADADHFFDGAHPELAARVGAFLARE